MSELPTYGIASGLPIRIGANIFIDANGDIYGVSGTKLILDESLGKIAPVEILGTNLPANTALINDTVAIGLIGFNGANRYYVFWDGTQLTFNHNNVTKGSITPDTTAGALIIKGITTTNMKISDTYMIHYQQVQCQPAITVDGLDISEYITAWQLSLSLITLQSGGYTNCIAGDIGLPVTVAGSRIGILYDYNNLGRIWTVLLDTYVETPTARAMAITGGTGAGTSTGTSTEAITRKQTIKTMYTKVVTNSATGIATIYLTDTGKAGGTALYSKEPTVTLTKKVAAPVIVPFYNLSADLKTLTITGDVSAAISVQVIGAV